MTGYRAAIGSASSRAAPVVALLRRDISNPRLARVGATSARSVHQHPADGAAEFGAFMVSEHAKWGRVIEDAEIKAE